MGKIASVHIFLNGMAMVFDGSGNQLPEFQGPWNEKKEAILNAIDGQKIPINFSSFRDWSQEVPREFAERLSLEVPE